MKAVKNKKGLMLVILLLFFNINALMASEVSKAMHVIKIKARHLQEK